MDKSPSCQSVDSFYLRNGKPFDKARISLAHQILSGIPDRRVNLLTFIRFGLKVRKTVEPDCGTLACAVGWLSMNPEFQKETGLLPGNLLSSKERELYEDSLLENGVRHKDFPYYVDFIAGGLAVAIDDIRALVPKSGDVSDPFVKRVSDMGTLLFNSTEGSHLDDDIRGDRRLREFFAKHGYKTHTDKGLALARLKLVYDHLSQ